MGIKITEIERLNTERTPGDYKAVINQNCCHIESNGQLIANLTFTYTPKKEEDAAFIAAAPQITEQYIKARKFVVTESFVLEVDAKFSELTKQMATTPENKAEMRIKAGIIYTQAVIDQLFAEVEATHD